MLGNMFQGLGGALSENLEMERKKLLARNSESMPPQAPESPIRPGEAGIAAAMALIAKLLGAKDDDITQFGTGYLSQRASASDARHRNETAKYQKSQQDIGVGLAENERKMGRLEDKRRESKADARYAQGRSDVALERELRDKERQQALDREDKRMSDMQRAQFNAALIGASKEEIPALFEMFKGLGAPEKFSGTTRTSIPGIAPGGLDLPKLSTEYTSAMRLADERENIVRAQQQNAFKEMMFKWVMDDRRGDPELRAQVAKWAGKDPVLSEILAREYPSDVVLRNKAIISNFDAKAAEAGMYKALQSLDLGAIEMETKKIQLQVAKLAAQYAPSKLRFEHDENRAKAAKSITDAKKAAREYESMLNESGSADPKVVEFQRAQAGKWQEAYTNTQAEIATERQMGEYWSAQAVKARNSGDEEKAVEMETAAAASKAMLQGLYGKQKAIQDAYKGVTGSDIITDQRMNRVGNPGKGSHPPRDKSISDEQYRREAKAAIKKSPSSAAAIRERLKAYGISVEGI